MNTLKSRLERYMRETIGIEVVLRDWEKARHFPQYLRARYRFFEMAILGMDCVVAVDNEDTEQTPANIGKQFDQIRSREPVTLVYVRDAVSSYNRKRLIEQKVPFIVPGNQMYLPMLGIDLREHIRLIRERRSVFSPSTQMLILSILWKKIGGVVTPSESAFHFGYSLMTMTRAFDELKQAGIGEHTTTGKARRLEFTETGQVLWNTALPFLVSPLRRRFYITDFDKDRIKGCLAGESALAQYSMLSDPNIPVYALAAEDGKRLTAQKEMVVLDHPFSDCCQIEIWKYAPSLFAQNGLVDRLSLYLSLRDNKDERIQIALDQVIGEMTW